MIKIDEAILSVAFVVILLVGILVLWGGMGEILAGMTYPGLQVGNAVPQSTARYPTMLTWTVNYGGNNVGYEGRQAVHSSIPANEVNVQVWGGELVNVP